jgi:hypothetical protein
LLSNQSPTGFRIGATCLLTAPGSLLSLTGSVVGFGIGGGGGAVIFLQATYGQFWRAAFFGLATYELCNAQKRLTDLS